MYMPPMVTFPEAQKEFIEVTGSRRVGPTSRKFRGPIGPRPGSVFDKPWVEPIFWDTLISLLNEGKITIA